MTFKTGMNRLENVSLKRRHAFSSPWRESHAFFAWKGWHNRRNNALSNSGHFHLNNIYSSIVDAGAFRYSHCHNHWKNEGRTPCLCTSMCGIIRTWYKNLYYGGGIWSKGIFTKRYRKLFEETFFRFLYKRFLSLMSTWLFSPTRADLSSNINNFKNYIYIWIR